RSQIVVAIGKGETVLVGRSDHHVCVGVVRCRGKKEQRTCADALQMRYRRGEFGLVVDRGDALELERKGLQSLLLDRRLVHARSVIIADLAARLRLDALARGRLCENGGEHRGDVLVESAVTPPA